MTAWCEKCGLPLDVFATPDDHEVICEQRQRLAWLMAQHDTHVEKQRKKKMAAKRKTSKAREKKKEYADRPLPEELVRRIKERARQIDEETGIPIGARRIWEEEGVAFKNGDDCGCDRRPTKSQVKAIVDRVRG